MKLITKALAKKVPALYAQDGKGTEATAYIKLFTPDANWTWFITEMDPETGDCFGLVVGMERELGYFNLNEIAKIRGRFGLPVERDRWFDPKPINQCN
jgi:hypothetical protein